MAFFAVAVVAITAIAMIVAHVVAVTLTIMPVVIVMTVAMALTVDGCIFIAVPVIVYKVGRMIAGIIAAAIAFPVLCMAWRHA